MQTVTFTQNQLVTAFAMLLLIVAAFLLGKHSATSSYSNYHHSYYGGYSHAYSHSSGTSTYGSSRHRSSQSR